MSYTQHYIIQAYIEVLLCSKKQKPKKKQVKSSLLSPTPLFVSVCMLWMCSRAGVLETGQSP